MVADQPTIVYDKQEKKMTAKEASAIAEEWEKSHKIDRAPGEKISLSSLFGGDDVTVKTLKDL